MTWTLEDLGASGLTIVVRNPELGDRTLTERRQAAGETEGGRLFVQDLGVEDQFIEGSWSGLTKCERDDLLGFFTAVKYRFGQSKLTVTGGGSQVPVGTGGTWSGRVRLDQSRIEFRAVTPGGADGSKERFETTMRFRIVTQDVSLQDGLQATDSLSVQVL